MSLDWHTEDEAGSGGSPAPPPPRHWSRLLAALLLAYAVLAVVWLITRRAEVGTQQVESDLVASYAVIEDAARHEDVELLLNFLSGREPAWTSAWEKIVAEGAYQERSAFGLTWLPAADPRTAVTEIVLSPQFDAAELVIEQAYSYNAGHGLTETVWLQQTAVFRRGQNRWLMSPPDKAFWGADLVVKKVHLSLQLPERDQAIANRLATDLDGILAALCADPLFDCPADLSLNVTFATDPATLTPNFKSLAYIGGSWSLRLPTPTLTGLPQDEAGYQALLRGYGTQLANPVMRQLHGISAVIHTPFLDAWMDWRLRALGLRPYPLSTADWQGLARQATSLSAGRELFRTNGAATPLTHAVIDFLIEDVGVPPEAIMRSFTSGMIVPYEDWLVDLTGGRLSFANLEGRWQAYIQTQAD